MKKILILFLLVFSLGFAKFEKQFGLKFSETSQKYKNDGYILLNKIDETSDFSLYIVNKEKNYESNLKKVDDYLLLNHFRQLYNNKNIGNLEDIEKIYTKEQAIYYLFHIVMYETMFSNITTIIDTDDNIIIGKIHGDLYFCGIFGENYVAEISSSKIKDIEQSLQYLELNKYIDKNLKSKCEFLLFINK